MNTINIADDFTPYPGGRYPEDGKGNGTDFRQRFLVPVLQKKDHAIIILDGALGYPSSFLEEAFGGLVRLGFNSDVIEASFTIEVDQPGLKRYKSMIIEYIRKATPTNHQLQP